MGTKCEQTKCKKFMINNFKNYYSPNQEHVEFAPGIHLKIGKIHEVCGPANTRIITFIGAKTKGLIVWIRPNWKDFTINSDNISHWFSPNQLLLINTKNKNDLFFAAEEVLRSGIAELTIIEPPEIPSSLQMRRINLANISGVKSNKSKESLSLILSLNEGGANSVESRWYISTLPFWNNLTGSENSILKQKWYIKRLFSRTEPIKEWSIETVPSEKKNMPPKLLSLPIR